MAHIYIRKVEPITPCGRREWYPLGCGSRADYRKRKTTNSMFRDNLAAAKKYGGKITAA